MKRKYNRKFYQFVQKMNGKIRDNFAPDPGAEFHRFGSVGKVFGWLFDHLIKKPVHFLTFSLVGLFYRKDRHSPYLGSFLYVLIFILVMGLVSVALRGAL